LNETDLYASFLKRRFETDKVNQVHAQTNLTPPSSIFHWWKYCTMLIISLLTWDL